MLRVIRDEGNDPKTAEEGRTQEKTQHGHEEVGEDPDTLGIPIETGSRPAS